MAGNSGSAGQSSKQDERRARNLASANASRQRRREEISSLTETKSRLNEANEMLRARLSMQPSGQTPPLRSVGSSSRRDVDDLGAGMQALMKKKDMDGKAVVDMFDRAVSGGKGKGAPVDADAAKKYAEASKKAPKDVKRPLKYVESGSASKSGAGGSKSQGKSKGSSSKKR